MGLGNQDWCRGNRHVDKPRRLPRPYMGCQIPNTCIIQNTRANGLSTQARYLRSLVEGTGIRNIALLSDRDLGQRSGKNVLASEGEAWRLGTKLGYLLCHIDTLE